MDEFKVPNPITKPINVEKINKQEVNKKNEEFLKDENSGELSVRDKKSINSPNIIECPYVVPKWSGKPPSNFEYKFEILKSGAIIEEVKNLQSKAYWMFGRLEDLNDIVMAHPTISRFHAVLQYKPKTEQEENDDDEFENSSNNSINLNDGSMFSEGWYIYDLGSTHGTFLNKLKLPPKTYFRVKVGHIIKLGGSTRSFILQGPESDEEPESELSVTELKELRVKHLQDKQKKIEKEKEKEISTGIDWGMGEDADEETDLSVNPYASTNNEKLFLDNPKKTLLKFFKRERLEFAYGCNLLPCGTCVCRIELPVGDIHGRPIIAEVQQKGKMNDCMIQCALEACRILDRYGVLRPTQTHQEPMKRKKPENDSDEDDDFLDRTGDIERKRLRKLSNNKDAALTYDDLIKEENDLLEKINTVEQNILKYQEVLKRAKETKEDQTEDLDNYMKNLESASTVDKIEIRKLRVEEQRLKSEHQKIQKLIKIAKPTELPSLQQTLPISEPKKKFTLPLFGKRNKLKINFIKSETKAKFVEKEMKSDEEEFDEDDEDQEEKNSKENENKVTKLKQIKTINEVDKNETENEQISSLKEESEKISQNDEEMVNDKEENPGSGNNMTYIRMEDENKSAFTVENNFSTTKNNNAECQESQKEKGKVIKITQKRKIGPSIFPKELLKIIQKQAKTENTAKEKAKFIELKEKQDVEDNENTDKTESSKTEKDLENFIIEKEKERENIDIDDSTEIKNKEKYSDWVPPENQTGDGMTSLNDKFGY